MIKKYCIIVCLLIFAFKAKTSDKQSCEISSELRIITALNDTIDTPKKSNILESVKKLNSNFSVDCVEVDKDLRYYYEIDFNTVEIISHRIIGSNRFNDELVLNDNRIGFFKGGVERTFIKNQNIYFCSAVKDSTYFYHLDDGSLNILQFINGQISPYNILDLNDQFILYIDDQKGGVLLSSLDKQNDRMLFDFSKLVDENKEFVKDIKINDYTWILEFGEWAGGYDNLSYYVYNRVENSFLEVSDKFNFNNYSHEIYYAYKCQSGNKLCINAPIISKNNQIIRQNAFILDSVLNLKGRALSLVSSNIYSPIGYKEINNSIEKYFFKLKQGGKTFKIAYCIIYELEELYFQICNNRMINDEALNCLTKSQLMLLMNLILANYGDNFTDPLVEKYYGIYNFYSKEEFKGDDIWSKISMINLDNLKRIIKKIETSR